MRSGLALLLGIGICQSQSSTPPPSPPPKPTPPTPTVPAGPTDPIVELASQSFHTCARRKSGEVLCWGRNTYGQLGNGNRDATDRVVKVEGLTDAMQLATGQDFTCALRRGGSVVCWGNNQDGQLGDGRGAKLQAWSMRPVRVADLGKTVQLTSGDWHACALEEGGAVRCWGNAENGQLGTDTDRAFARPRAIDQLGPVSMIASGSAHVCALQRDGRVKCWGRNTEGQLGDGKSGSRIKPVFVSGIEGATAVWSGHTFSCAQVRDGGVRCWGDNKKGQLGPDAGRDAKWNVPISMKDLRDVEQLVGGQQHACARDKTGRVRCWGGNEDGRAAGQGSGVVARPTPVRGIGDAVAVAAGAIHTCAALRSGDVKCWGGADDGQLGRYRLATVFDGSPRLSGGLGARIEIGYDEGHADSSAAVVGVGPVRL